MSDIAANAVAARGSDRWYVVVSQSTREFRAALHLNNQGFHTFLPLCRKTVRHARQFRTKPAPLFPRYLFVELALDRDRWRSVNGTFGVSHLIMEGDRPKPVPVNIVERLIEATDTSGLVSTASGLQPGDAVRIVTGPFAGTVGELAALDEKGRVKVLLELMGSVVAVSAKDIGVVAAA